MAAPAEDRYRTLLRSAPFAIFELDANGLCIDVNEHWCRLVGQSATDAYGHGWAVSLHPEDRDAVGQEWLNSISEDRPFQLRYRLVHLDGHVIWVDGHITSIVDQTGVLRGYLGFAVDRTEEERSGAALQEEAARSRALITALPDKVFRVHRNGTILDAHLPDPERSAATREQMLGARVEDVWKDASVLAHFRRAIDDCLTQRVPQTVEYTLPTPIGMLDFEARLAPLGEDEVAVISRDISDRKGLERLKSEFIATVSHELRTPLTSVRAAVGLLRAGVGGPLPTEARELVDLAVANAERLTRLVDDILDLERLQAGSMSIDLAAFDLVAAAQTSLELIRPAALAASTGLFLEHPPHAVMVVGDPERFLQVLGNLLSNALKHTPIAGRIDVRVYPNGRITVANPGTPIPSAFRTRIFGRFTQADPSDQRVRGGSGLGLAITKALTEAMGGTIDYESDERGTVFWVELPTG